MTTPRYVPAKKVSAPEQRPWQRSAGFQIPTQRSAPPPPTAAPTPPPAPGRDERQRVGMVLKIGLGAAVGLLVGLLIGSAAAGQTTAATDIPQADATSTIPAGGGRFRVGTDLEPGTYQTAGPDDSSSTGCYYARLRSGDGTLGDIMDNYVSQGPMTVEVSKSDGYFQTTGCDTWTKVN